MKRIIILRGPAGAGKTTIGRILKKRLGDSLLFNIDMICSDMIGGHPRDKEIRYAAHELCYSAAKKAKKQNLIFERLFNLQDDIDHISKLFSSLKYQVFIFTLKVSLPKLIKQDSGRNNPLGSDDIKRLYGYFIKSDVKNPGIVINVGNKKPITLVEEILKCLKK